MTREVIFEAYYGGKFWRKLLCRLFMHLWSSVIDIDIGETADHDIISMRIMRCVDCGVYKLWILKEKIIV